VARALATGGAAVRGRAGGPADGVRRRPFDLIHAHHAWCGAACAAHGVPFVLSLLGSDLVAFPWRGDREGPLSRRVSPAVARSAARRAAAVIVKAEWMRAALGDGARGGSRAHVIPNGVDLGRFRPAAGDAERRALRADLGLPADDVVVIFGADPARPRKRFALAQAAVADAERRRAAAEASRVRRPLRLVSVHGRPHDDVARFLRAADLLLFTSEVEGSPNVVKEAMASGLAIVSTDVGDTRERLEGVSGCRVAADEPEALGSAIADLLDGGEARLAREAVAELSLEKVAERVASVYRAALERARG
jgi:glycosyltransferase involved in cell wall biosynthesis